jgi:hypothetical protein
MIPAESVIERAKAQYEHALKRAMQIALSEGIRIGLWNIGTGTGTAQNAEKAYLDGLEDFEFAPRMPLPQTVYDKIQSVTAENAQSAAKIDLMAKAESVTSLSSSEVLRQGGYNDVEIAKIKAEKSQEDSTVNSADGTDTLNGTDGAP